MIITNSYHDLGPQFYQQTQPTEVDTPELVLWNDELAEQLNVAKQIVDDAASYFSGNRLLPGSIPLAQAYAGHQFGGFNPQLGDGRAHLLGDIESRDNKRYDLQLKGSGITQFSRRGDGRCALKPAVREFIMSEAMHALGIATTRSLSVVTTGETLYRGTAAPGAVVSRVASSHIRVGTFQFFAAKGDTSSLERLLDYAIERHFPALNTDITLNGDEKVMAFIESVIDRQVETVVNWMRVGFIHGVMNTDNMTISGETIDYGPCAMMGVYHPETVYSSIDEQGRYCYGNQPAILQWNMARLAETLLPLMVDSSQHAEASDKTDSDKAVAKVEPLILAITEKYQESYYAMMSEKFGVARSEAIKREFIDAFLQQMQENKLDYSQTFARLTSVAKGATDELLQRQFGDLFLQWQQRLSFSDSKHVVELMEMSNPVVIPRNHHMEEVLAACEEEDNYQPALQFLTVLRSPYKAIAQTTNYQDLPHDGDMYYRTFCGT